MFIFFVILTCVIEPVFGFYPRQPPHWRTKTHVDITNTGVLQAIAEYIINHNLTYSPSLSMAVDDFFGPDISGKANMHQTISTVKKSIADTQEEKRHVAYVHCHADQIKLAHNHVIACREGLLLRKDDLEELRKQLGVCLYTIQSFYSNTNWVEMKGRTPYLSFGIKGEQLMEVATEDEDTCKDMADISTNCKNNLLVTDRLTSGYHHGRGNIKPPRPLGSKTGKCSHGGPDDESRKLIAKCGINKETTIEKLSPHYHLHDDAYLAAAAATKYFLIGEGTGIVHLLGEKTFTSLFNIKQRQQVSLSFAVDYSGSMSGEIKAVKEEIIQLVTSTIGSENEPSDYVLSLFNDPANLNKAFIYTDGLEMINKISSVVVDGGGDCPELAAAGILKAIELSRKGSTVMVFTDADAKDEDRQGEVTAAALAKNIKITTVLTGNCSKTGRKRRDIPDRVVRETLFFDGVAKDTGGTLYKTDKDNIGAILYEVVQTVFPTSEVIIESYNWPVSVSLDRPVMVDGSIQVLKISIKGASGTTDVDLFYPNGTKEQFTSPAASRLYTSNNEIIMSLQKPSQGIYSLHKNTDRDWTVNITAQSSIKVGAEMLEITSSGALISMKGSPIVGNNYTYVFTVYNLGNGTCNTISLVNTQGHTTDTFIPHQTSDIDVECTVAFTVTNSVFQVRLNGTDEFGHPLYRTTSKIYKPTSVELRVTASSDDVPVGIEREIPYEVVNSGSDVDMYDVHISDDHSFVKAPLTHYLRLSPGETANGTFNLVPNELVGMFKYRVTLTMNTSSEIIQSIAKTLVVTNIERPTCHVLSTSGTCDPPSLNTANCSKYQWYSELKVDFSETQLDDISSTGGYNVQLIYDNITGVLNGPITVNISGDCCTPSTTVSVVDTGGYISQCHFELSDGKPVEPVNVVKDEHNTASTPFFIVNIAIATIVNIIRNIGLM